MSAYGAGLMPMSVLKAAAGRKVETSVDQHLAAMGKSGSDVTSDEEDSFGAKRLSVASAGVAHRPPFPPTSAAHQQHLTQQQYLAMLQVHSW